MSSVPLFCKNINPIVVKPTLPKNITNMSTIFPVAESSGVMPQDNPTVPNAEKHSNKMFSKRNNPAWSAILPRSEISNTKADTIMISIPAIKMLTAFRALYVLIFRLLMMMSPFLRNPETADSNKIIKDVVFMPPPVEPGDAPMNIRIIVPNFAAGVRAFWSIVANPAVRVVTD